MYEIEDWNGLKLIKGESHFYNWVKQANRLDHDYYHLNTLMSVLPKKKLDVLVIGAFIGTMTKYFDDRKDNVIAIEPQKLAFECLVHNCPNTKCINAAVANEIFKFESEQLAGDNLGMSTIKKSKKKSALQTIRIDDLELEGLDLIIIDAEGYELEILKSAEKTIEKFSPVVDIEVNDNTLKLQGLTDNDIYNWFQEKRYKLVKSVGQKPQLDCIFKKI